MIRAWHFVGDTLRDGRPIPADGVLLKFDGTPIPCERGLHASRHPFDALQYAPGNTLCLVECGGIIVPHGEPEDKIACTERRIIVRMDAEPLLRHFSRQQALSVVDMLGDNPPDVVLDWLMTGDESIRESARASAWASAWASARASARASAWASAWASALDSAWASALDSARADFAALVNEAFEDWL